MTTNLKALVVILILAGIAFRLARPMAMHFMSTDDFIRRRNVWMTLTAAGLVSPSFWIFVPIATVVLVRAARHDPNPAALFFLAITAVPSVTFPIPTIGIGALFDLNHARLLSLVLLLPVAVRTWGRPREGQHGGVLQAIDICVLGFIAVQSLVLLPYESVTNVLRRDVHFALDFGLIYYVLSRTLARQSRLYEALATFVLACAVLAPIALFETMRTWLLYSGVGEQWGRPDLFSWLWRGDSLRAQATAGHSLALGFQMAIGFGLSLALVRFAGKGKQSVWIGAWMWMGLIAAYSRAPWLTAGMFAVLVSALAPGGATNLKKLMLLTMIGGGGLLASPWGDDVLDLLPFIGSVDNANVVYRQELATLSWKLIQKNPVFGDPLVMRDMESLRQGQGIIDLVNAYASVALFNGLVGLSLFVTPLLLGSFYAYRVSRSRLRSDPDDALLGAVLVSAMLATLFFIATSNFGWILYALLGMVAAYLGCDRRELTPVTPVMPLASTALPAIVSHRPRRAN